MQLSYYLQLLSLHLTFKRECLSQEDIIYFEPLSLPLIMLNKAYASLRKLLPFLNKRYNTRATTNTVVNIFLASAFLSAAKWVENTPLLLCLISEDTISNMGC